MSRTGSDAAWSIAGSALTTGDNREHGIGSPRSTAWRARSAVVSMHLIAGARSSTRGMVNAISYLIEWSETSEEFKPFGRRQRKNAQRDAAAAKASKA